MNPIDSENNFSDDDDDDDESSSSSEKVQIIKEDDEEEDSSSDSDSEDSSSDSSDSSSSSNNQEKPKTRIPYTKTPMNRGLVWRDTQDVAFKFMMDRENQIQTVHSNPTQVIYAPNGGIRGGVIQGGMGVGKTGMIFRLAFEGPNVTGFPDLAIFNLSLLSSAEEDLKKLFPKKIQKQVLFLHKSMMTAKQIKNLTRASLSKYRLVVTNYDLVRTTCYDYDFQEEIQEYAETSENDRGHVVCINERTFAQSNTFKGYTGASLLFGVPWNRVMLDESQIIRTPTAKKTIACMALYGHTKWCFSGTPIVNGSLDLWSQLRFCGFKNCKNQSEWNKESASLMHHYTLQDAIFKLDADNSGIPPLNRKMIEIDLNEFERNVYENTLEITRKILSLVKTGEVTYAFMLVMFIYLKQCMISPYLISTKSKRKSNADQTVALGDEVFNSYFDAKTIEKHEKDFEDFCKENKINVESTRSAPPALQYVPTEEEKMKSSSSIAFVGMMSPSLLSNPDVQEIRAPVPDNASKEDIEKAIISIENEINETINKKQMTDIISNIDGPAGIYCTSMNSVISFIEGINGNSDTKGEKLIIFSHYVGALDLAKYTIKKRLPKIKTILVDGSVTAKKRKHALKKFRKNSKYQVLLINTTIGGLGLNLTVANWGILLDNWWNDMIPDQAVARMHRFGQTRPVTVVEFYRSNTIDERVFQVREEKQTQIAEFLGDQPKRRGPRSKFGRGAGIDLYTMTRILK